MRPLLRILTAVPQTVQARLELAKAIRTLAAQDEEEKLLGRVDIATVPSAGELAAEIVREFCRELSKAGFNPDEPRVPAGNPEGGQWTTGGGNGASNDPRILSDAAPDNTWKPGAQYAANDPPDVRQNQEPPLASPPEVPPEEPATAKAVNTFLKAAAYWLAAAALAGEPAGDFILALEAVEWLYEFRPWIDAYLDPPKTLEELQNDLSPLDGYDIHHIVEQTPASNDGYSDSLIDSPENLVRIPTLKHWLINGWYSRPNPDFNYLSPRDYLRGDGWDERVRVGKMALTLYGVLQP
jgi:hypothetical protein